MVFQRNCQPPMLASFGFVHDRSAPPSRAAAASPVGALKSAAVTSFDHALAPAAFTARTWNP